MFYPVRVFDCNGNLVEEVSGLELSHSYWKKFRQEEDSFSLIKSGRKRLPDKIKKMIALQFFSLDQNIHFDRM